MCSTLICRVHPRMGTVGYLESLLVLQGSGRNECEARERKFIR